MQTHVSRSKGFKTKITDNPHMNGDFRNIAVVATTDGVPLFDDQHRGMWPFILRMVNPPDDIALKFEFSHTAILSGNEYWELDEATNEIKRRVRSPKSLMPHLLVLIDDLLGAYNVGETVVDSTRSLGDPDRVFRCRVMLLYFTGDYPAIAAVSGTHSKTCHWCEHKSSAAPEVNRRRFDQHY